MCATSMNYAIIVQLLTVYSTRPNKAPHSGEMKKAFHGWKICKALWVLIVKIQIVDDMQCCKQTTTFGAQSSSKMSTWTFLLITRILLTLLLLPVLLHFYDELQVVLTDKTPNPKVSFMKTCISIIMTTSWSSIFRYYYYYYEPPMHILIFT